MTSVSEDILNICEQEKLHLSNAIQGYGFLIALDKDGLITHASENIKDFLDVEAENVLGEPYFKILGDKFDLESGIRTPQGNRRFVFGVKLPGDKLFDILMIESEASMIIELQPSVRMDENLQSQSHRLTSLLTLSHSGASKQTLLREVANSIRELTGFEKVMIYQFQHDWSGEVVEELGGTGTFDEYIGLRFPASDIPKIARDLYCQTPYRLIHNSKMAQVNVVTKSQGAASLDLTYSDLRSVSPVHVEYLKNMNVAASLSFPIMVSEELWGLVALHHPEERYLSIELRNQCADVVTAFALALKSITTHERMAVIDGLDRKISNILSELDLKTGKASDLVAVEHELLDIVGATGGALIMEDYLHKFGEAPDEDIILDIDSWYLKHDGGQIASSDTISRYVPSCAHHKDICSGVLCLKTIYGGNEDGIRFYWYRPELPQQINWAGEPNKVVNDDASPLPVSPRRSFNKWTEITSARSKEWDQADQMAAAKFRAMVLRALLK